MTEAQQVAMIRAMLYFGANSGRPVECASRVVTKVDYIDPISFFIDGIDYAVDVRLVAEEQLMQVGILMRPGMDEGRFESSAIASESRVNHRAAAVELSAPM